MVEAELLSIGSKERSYDTQYHPIPARIERIVSVQP